MSPSARNNPLRRARPLLGTLVEITTRGRNRARLAAAVDAAFLEMETVQRLMSFHDAASDVSRLNREGAARPVRVDRRTWTVLRRAGRIARASDGAFDITVAPTLAAWGFLPIAGDGPPAAPKDGYRAVELLTGSRIRFKAPLWIDLGGIAKGYAVDRACAALARHGVRDYLVNAGGDLRVGRRPERVLVRHPAEPARLLPLADLQAMAVASSGSYFSSRRRGTRLLYPLVVPGESRPARLTGGISVMAPECMTADALTKVVAVHGSRAAGLLPRFQASAVLVSHTGELQPLAESTAETRHQSSSRRAA